MNTRQTIAATLIIVVVAIGLWLGWTGYRHGLPYIDEPDEMTLWTMGRARFDPSWPMFQPHYPPGMVYVSSIVQRLEIASGNPFYDESGTTATMRMLSALNYSITLLLIMWLAYRFVGLHNGLWSAVAAAFAGCAWFALPLVTGRAKLAVTDPWLWLWMTSSVAVGVEGWHRKSIRWIALSLLLAMVTAAFKWQGAAVLAVPGLACLRFWAIDRKRALLYIAVYGVLTAIFAYWAIFIHGALEGDAYLPGVYTIRPTLAIVLRNIQAQLTETGTPLAVGLLPGLALILPIFTPVARRQFYVDFPLWMFPVVLVCYDVILSFNGAPVSARQYLALNALQAVMAGIGLVLLLRTGLQIILHFLSKKAANFGRIVTLVVLAVVLSNGLVAPWTAAFQNIYSANQQDLLPDRRNVLAQWASTTATDGALIVTQVNLIAALQTLYGYQGRPLEYPFNQGTSILPSDSQITQQMIDSGHIRYLITQPNFQSSGLTSPITRLITYDSDDPQPFRGDTWSAFYVGQLPALLPSTQIFTYNQEIVLRGFSVSNALVCPGTTIGLRALWSALHPPSLNYSIYLHLFNASTGEIDASPSSASLAGRARPTISWTRVDELLIGYPFSAKIPAGVPPGQYQLWLGVFEPLSGQRLTLPNGKDHAIVATVTVEPCPPSRFF